MHHHASKIRDPKCPCCRPGSRKGARIIVNRSARRQSKMEIRDVLALSFED